ncbi:TetR/AcrR family transcriptional regulator [Mycobacterium shimoidei]|uniref:Transcriptional regulator [Gordonia sp. KTR9] n=1 Tax=Mycobacterium shimoidei TaxID=29313 RepID=A0A1E3TKC8_MYCSH|nr:TetR/AcrR family transcriptional regulator [Mycobacterium shimoidei]MCV7260036.1 TetR/AcrR family transcriptional regulator [Mycobacterium shimoidei]ODR14935.1 TetR family transcriptional regulator [Mycobacterium shimoidei]ORW79103.1 TetR family transcriptional regulator [Mycobacterium shimoidei]SRX94398.1 Transcriptional regulator [Gordonia sp. KTR9] [Mycobacterium shimoidei]
MTQATATDTRNAIISAAFACFRTQGLAKTTIVDIARAAGVSRSTFYEYFRDKETIVEACAEAASQRFYRNMAKAIDRHGGSTLEGRLVQAAVFVSQARRVVEPEAYFDEAEVSLMMTKNAAMLLKECTEFLAPYVSAARLTGEVRADLDIPTATEWFARILFSLFTTPSPTIDMRDDDAVAEFVRAYVVNGFVDGRARRR